MPHEPKLSRTALPAVVYMEVVEAALEETAELAGWHSKLLIEAMRRAVPLLTDRDFLAQGREDGPELQEKIDEAVERALL